MTSTRSSTSSSSSSSSNTSSSSGTDISSTEVTFDSAGIPLAGILHLPGADAAASADASDPGASVTATTSATSASARRLPAIVVGHPGSGVKEQAAGLYARLLAARGFPALAFDAAFQGESGGLPRGLEDPTHRVEDLKAAVSFLSTRPEVDPERIGMLGICASGGYALSAAGGDRRVRAVATVSAVDIARQFRFGADGTQDPAVFRAMLDAAAQARTAAARGSDPGTLTLFPETADQARRLGGEHAVEGFDYYRTPRAYHPRSAQFLDWTSVDKMAGFDAFAAVPLLGDRPLLLAVGTRAVTSWMSVEAFQAATGPKEIFWVDSASHVDLYDRDVHVRPVIDRLAEFFGRTLASAHAPGPASAHAPGNR